jgi:hypothetical protein
VIDRRSRFFAAASLVCIALIPLSDPSLRWVPIVVSITYAVLAVLSFLDWRSRVR